ncbi:mitochondrial import inner membrane translocase subunit Tim8 B-like [Artemia franciscana]|uniref:Mitochondrial import inner membrane translocase subunit n=1 Tax=Artemia franciscana TaxID=6661 RepID=A0AA88HQ18_ARTSF|nr:hypothetical protein QYM36_011671 [Artemia franciscana]
MFGFGGSSDTSSGSSSPESDLSSFSVGENPIDFTSSSPMASGLGSAGSSGVDADLQRTLMIEQQRAQFQAQIHKVTDICWDMCMDKPKSSLDSRTETCIANCTERFLDHTILITKRFAQLLQKSAGY